MLQKRGQIYYFRWVVPECLVPILNRTALVKSLRTSNYWEAQKRGYPFSCCVRKILRLKDQRTMGFITQEYFELMIEHVWNSVQKTLDFGPIVAAEEDEMLQHYLDAMSDDNFNPKEFSELFKSLSKTISRITFDRTLQAENDELGMVAAIDCLRNDFISDATAGMIRYESLDDDDRRYVDQIVYESTRAMAYQYQELGVRLDIDERIQPPKFLSLAKNSIKERKEKESSTCEKPAFSEVYNAFLKYKISCGLSPKIQKEYQRYFSDWCEVAQDKGIDEYNKKDVERFLMDVSTLPKRNLKPYRDVSVKELLEMEIPAEHLIAGKTGEQYKKWIQGVFAYARDEELISVSPVVNLKIDFNKSDTTYAVYSDAEIKRLINKASCEKTEWHKWVVLIGAYTGMRLGEINALHSEAIRYDEDSASYYILVTDEYGGGLKTDAAKRIVPLHQKLLDDGFLEWAKSKGGALFNVEARTMTQWFGGSFRESAGVSQKDDYGKRKVFHSFRHTFVTKARSKGVDLGLIQQVVGHEKTSAGVTDRYTHQFPVKELLVVMNAIEYGV